MKYNYQRSNHACTARRVFTSLLSVWFCCVTLVSHPVFAQSANSDFESPIIEHVGLASGNWGDVQIFEAAVVDNDAVKRVRLFYRYTGDLEYTEIEMQQLASSSSYTANIDTGINLDPRKAIEYYIRAEDASDNLVLKGFAFEPLVRTLVNATTPPKYTLEPAATVSAESEPVQKKSGINWLYVAIGVLVVGGIAAGGGGGSNSGDSGTVDGNCDPNCSVTFMIPAL